MSEFKDANHAEEEATEIVQGVSLLKRNSGFSEAIEMFSEAKTPPTNSPNLQKLKSVWKERF